MLDTENVTTVMKLAQISGRDLSKAEGWSPILSGILSH